MGGGEGLPEQQTPVSGRCLARPSFGAALNHITGKKRLADIFLFCLLLVSGGRLPCTSNAGHLDYITQSCIGRGCLAAAHRQTLGATRLAHLLPPTPSPPRRRPMFQAGVKDFFHLILSICYQHILGLRFGMVSVFDDAHLH